MKYLGWFLDINSNANCPDNGSPFSADVVTVKDAKGEVTGIKTARHAYPPFMGNTLSRTRLRGIHSLLVTQHDFINALSSAYNLADEVKKKTGLDVFPYSVFYIFFEQYLYIVDVAWLTISLAFIGTSLRVHVVILPVFVAIFLVTLATVGNVTLSVLIVLVVCMIEVDLLGMMAVWNVRAPFLSCTVMR